MLWGACASSEPVLPDEAVPSAAFTLPATAEIPWPRPGVALRTVTSDAPVRGTIYVDPGHGTGSNQGAVSTYGELEMVHTLAISRRLAEELAPFRVVVGRKDERGPSYPARIERAAEVGAGALVSIHADVRGAVELWEPLPGKGPLRRVLGSEGFAILYSSQGTLGPARKALAQALAKRMTQAGFHPYDGADYGTLYDTDPDVPGVFRDRRGLAMLRRPSMPSVIVETHNALHPGEVARWRDPVTVAAFGAAVRAGLADALAAAAPGYPAVAEGPP